jgi:glycosyltransferase involved in cell wall biosynthesis
MVSRELETMACGTVVLGDRLPTNERLFEDCILFTDGFNDVVEKANMILEGKLAMDLIAKGFEKVKEHTWDKRVESIMDVLKI